MTIIGLLVFLIIVGVLLYLVNTLIPIDAKVKTLINVVVVLFLCLFCLEAFGLIGPWHLGNGPRLR